MESLLCICAAVIAMLQIWQETLQENRRWHPPPTQWDGEDGKPWQSTDSAKEVNLDALKRELGTQIMDDDCEVEFDSQGAFWERW